MDLDTYQRDLKAASKVVWNGLEGASLKVDEKRSLASDRSID